MGLQFKLPIGASAITNSARAVRCLLRIGMYLRSIERSAHTANSSLIAAAVSP